MDPETVPSHPQSEGTSPVHGSDEGRTVPRVLIDPSTGPAHPSLRRASTSNVSRPPTGHFVLPPTSSEHLSTVTETLFHQSADPTRHLLPPVPAVLPEPKDAGRTGQFSTLLTRLLNSGEPRGVDSIIIEHKHYSVGERLEVTLKLAREEKIKCAIKAKWSGIAINLAIGAQVLLGALTTGLSALSISGGASTAKATTALGALATLVASYLARARGSGEPDTSTARTQDLEQFIRECLAFQMDHGYKDGDEFEADLLRFRRRLEEILGNADNNKR